MGTSENNRFPEKLIIFIFYLYLVNGIGFPFKGGLEFVDYRRRAEKPVNKSELDIKWIDQPLDHFDETEVRTWKMRYGQNIEFYQPNTKAHSIIKLVS